MEREAKPNHDNAIKQLLSFFSEWSATSNNDATINTIVFTYSLSTLKSAKQCKRELQIKIFLRTATVTGLVSVLLVSGEIPYLFHSFKINVN